MSLYERLLTVSNSMFIVWWALCALWFIGTPTQIIRFFMMYIQWFLLKFGEWAHYIFSGHFQKKKNLYIWFHVRYCITEQNRKLNDRLWNTTLCMYAFQSLYDFLIILQKALVLAFGIICQKHDYFFRAQMLLYNWNVGCCM